MARNKMDPTPAELLEFDRQRTEDFWTREEVRRKLRSGLSPKQRLARFKGAWMQNRPKKPRT